MKRTMILPIVIILLCFSIFDQNGTIYSRDSKISEGNIVVSGWEMSSSGRGKSDTRPWGTAIVDSEGIVGLHSSLALDGNGHPHISYHHVGNDDLKYATFDGNDWSTQVVDPVGNVGSYTSIAVDSSGNPHICYCDTGNDHLKYAYYDGNNWHTESVDISNGGRKYTSMALDSQDRPHISFFQCCPDNILYYMYHDGAQWHKEAIDSSGSSATFTSLALDSNDRPRISYQDTSFFALRYVYYDGDQWIRELVDSDGDVGDYSSLVLDLLDNPHISYWDSLNDDLKYAYHDGVGWDNWTLDSSGDVGQYTSLALDSQDRPYISYWDSTNEFLKCAYNIDSVWYNETVDSRGFIGASSISMALGPGERPHISYYSSNSGSSYDDLKYATFDHGPPTLEADHTPGTGTTGDLFGFNISANDEMSVDRVDVNWSHGRYGGNVTLDLTGDHWLEQVKLDHEAGGLVYTIYINDSAGNCYVGEPREVPVLDNDPPLFHGYGTSETATTGEVFNVSISVTDNIGVTSAYLRYGFDDRGTENRSMEKIGEDTWGMGLLVPTDVSHINCSFIVFDAVGNMLFSGNFSHQVLDNDAPVARAGNDIRVDQNKNVKFDGSESSDNIGIVNFTWSFFHEGIAVYLFGSAPVVTFRIAGTYTITLTVTDAAGNLHTDVIVITVNDITAPEARPGDELRVLPGQSAVLDGSGSTDNIEIVNHTWSFVYEQREVKLYGEVVHFTFHIPGSYNISLTVRDAAGNTHTAFLLVTVGEVTVEDVTPPIAVAGKDRTGYEREIFVFNANLSSDNIGIVNYTWTFLYGDEERIFYGMMSNITFGEMGTYNITLAVRDEAGNVAADMVTITILDGTAPVANGTASSYKVSEGSRVTFDGSGSTDNAGVVNWTWRIGLIWLYGPEVNFTFDEVGEYNITLNVTDYAGNYDEMTFSVVVEPVQPPEEEESDDRSSWVENTVALVVVTVLLLIVIFIFISKRKRREAPPPDSSHENSDGSSED